MREDHDQGLGNTCKLPYASNNHIVHIPASALLACALTYRNELCSGDGHCYRCYTPDETRKELDLVQ